MAEQAEEELRRRLAAAPIYGLLGIELERCDREEVAVRVDVGERHANLDGWLHGGVLALLADTAMGIAARLVAEEGARNRTLNVGLSFQSAAKVGDGVRCAARVSNQSRRFVWTSCEIRRIEDGGLIAEGSALHYPSVVPQG
jgi:uncharacterized protein (TIGR00369 family)